MSSRTTSAEEGPAELPPGSPRLVIVDLMMEEVDAGAGFVRELRVLGNQAPVYMLSSIGDSLSTTVDYASLG